MLSGIPSVLLIPLYAWIFGHSVLTLAGLILLTGLILLAHRSHIAALLKTAPQNNCPDERSES
jgi:hypothetical protein